ncbi:XkdQ/YqbQ family protein [Brevibacillus fluminis]|uniref:XkdQ/YqbQ family protein n=1 Tax=Brevibacillus fluminis TaxID=511487 RepID=UPI003F8A9C0E
MKIIYGKDATRIDLTNKVVEVSWSSSRGQLAQSCELRVRDAPALEAAGFVMLFSGTEPKEAEQFFHGPIVRWERDDKSGDISATAYELGWYLSKNDVSRPKLNGDAGKELERLVRQTGIPFSCPAFGFISKERLSSQSYASLYSSLTEQAFDKSGIRYFVQHARDKLAVLPEGGNPLVPLFRASMLQSSSTGESVEEVYTVVTAERYKGEKIAKVATRENTALTAKLGRMQKVVDAGEEQNVEALAAKQLAELAKVPRTRSIAVRHEDPNAAKLRAGWRIKIAALDGRITDWIVTSCQSSWTGGQYTMNLQLEWRG